MPDITPRLNLPKPLSNENVNRLAHNALVDAIEANAAKQADVGDMAAVPTTAKDAAGAITELFTSVSDGKTLVAAAITDKGVPTAADDTFAEMAGNIDSIQVGPDTSDATATAADILLNETAYGAAGTKITGTMPNNGAMIMTPGAADIPINKGYHSGTGKVLAVPVDPTKVLVGTTIAGTPGEMPNQGAKTLVPGAVDVVIPAGYHNGLGKVAKVVVPVASVLAGTTIAGQNGTMPNRAGDTAALASSVVGTTLKLRASQGYRDGVNDNVTITDANFLGKYIQKDIPLFGLVGTLELGKKYASGSGTAIWDGSRSRLTVAGLGFTPSLVIARSQLSSIDNYGIYCADVDVVPSIINPFRLRQNPDSTDNYSRYTNTLDLSVTADGFIFDAGFGGNVSCNWIAIE